MGEKTKSGWDALPKEQKERYLSKAKAREERNKGKTPEEIVKDDKARLMLKIRLAQVIIQQGKNSKKK